MSEVKENTAGSSPVESQQEGQGQIQEPQVSAEDLLEQVKGLKQGIQAEKEKRQSVEQQYKLMEQLAYTQQSQPPQEESFDPDDIPTNESVQKMIQKEVGSLKGTQHQMTQAQQMQILRMQDPDFDKMVGVGSYFDDIQKATPGLLQAVESLPNGVEVAYRMAKSHPEYQKMIQEKAANDVISQTEKNLSKPPKISGGGDEQQFPDYEKMLVDNPEQFEKEILKAKGFNV